MFQNIKEQIRLWFKKMTFCSHLFPCFKIEKRKTKKRVKYAKGFTLPEVIISFSVLILVITSATGVLVTVLRSNSDNVNSLVAYGLAQEGIEAMRFIRDSDVILGLGFDGTKSTNDNSPLWGSKLFEKGSPSFFALGLSNSVIQGVCDKTQISDCLPLKIRNLNGSDEVLDDLKKTDSTRVYKNSNSEGTTSSSFFYFQIDSSDSNNLPTQYHRVIRVEPVGDPTVNKLIVSSIVSWTNENGLNKDVVLTTELTDWKS